MSTTINEQSLTHNQRGGLRLAIGHRFHLLQQPEWSARLEHISDELLVEMDYTLENYKDTLARAGMLADSRMGTSLDAVHQQLGEEEMGPHSKVAGFMFRLIAQQWQPEADRLGCAFDSGDVLAAYLRRYPENNDTTEEQS